MKRKLPNFLSDGKFDANARTTKFLRYKGKILYITEEAYCQEASHKWMCKLLRQPEVGNTRAVLGLDIEWRVTFKVL